MGLARATRNLARTARVNPMWALLGVLLAPFRFARHVFTAVVFGIALFLGLFFLLLLSIWMFELDKNGVVAQLALMGIITAVVLVTAWMFVLPLGGRSGQFRSTCPTSFPPSQRRLRRLRDAAGGTKRGCIGR